MLEFESKTHTYKYDGVDIPSVSEILRFCHREVYEEPDKFLMDKAADRGTRVHKADQELDETGQTEADSDIEQYVSAYVKFLNEHQVKWELIEQPVAFSRFIGMTSDTDTPEYAGTIDRFGTVDGENVLLDIKTTSKITKKHKLMYAAQLAGYFMALVCKFRDEALAEDREQEEFRCKTAILQLKSDGTYKLMFVPAEFGVFEACLNLHKAFAATKRKGKKNNG